MKTTVGRIVNFVLENGEVRPAIIVRVWTDDCVNLRVFFDGSNDAGNASYDNAGDLGWVTSVTRCDPTPPGFRARSWHWPVRA